MEKQKMELIEYEDIGFFTKVKNFILNFFRREEYYEDDEEYEEDSEELYEDEFDEEKEKNKFLNGLKLQAEEDEKLLILQNKYENRIIDFDSMIDADLHSLSLLYDRQIENLKKAYESKKYELDQLQKNNRK